MNIFNLFKRTKESSGDPKALPSVPQLLPAQEEASLSTGFVCKHPDWVADCRTSGSNPESTQIAMARQFARVLGDILAKHTTSESHSVACLTQALKEPVQLAWFDTQLFGAVETVSNSFGYDRATTNLVSYVDSLLPGASLPSKLATTAALIRETVKAMFGDMLNGPKDPDSRMSKSGDESMCCRFDERGEVESLHISMMPGKLVHHFKGVLDEAQTNYNAKKAAVLGGDETPSDTVFALTLQVGLKTTRYITTQDALMKSYCAALLRYASTSYANRVRDGNPAIELQEQKLINRKANPSPE
jgi:hypothetical protein